MHQLGDQIIKINKEKKFLEFINSNQDHLNLKSSSHSNLNSINNTPAYQTQNNSSQKSKETG